MRSNIRSWILALAVWSLSSGTAAVGQGSGSVATPPSVSGTDGAPFQVTKAATGTVREVAETRLVIEDEKKKTTLELKVDGKVLVRGKGGRKTLDSLSAGTPVRVQYTPAERVAVEIRILELPR